MSKILIDTGMSPRGWSYYGNFARCPHLFALVRLGGYNEQTEPLIKGTMGHITQAHLHVRWQCEQTGQNPDAYYTPEDALWEWVGAHPEGKPFHALMIEVFRRYVARYPQPPGKIIGVEHMLRGVIGYCNGVWGLWTLADGQDWFDLPWRTGGALPRHVSGVEIQPTCINMPGSPIDGEPVLVTKRIDLIVEDKAGYVHVWDHKNTVSDVSPKRAEKYAMDAQFAITRVLSSQRYGKRFGQSLLNLIELKDPWRVARPTLPPTPYRDTLLANNTYFRAQGIAQLMRDFPNPHHWPMTEHELACSHRYGDCAFLTNKVCSHGPLAA